MKQNDASLEVTDHQPARPSAAGAVWALTQLTLSLFGGLCIGAILGAVLGGWLGLSAGFAEGTDSLAQLLNALWQGILGAETGALVGGGSGLLLSLSLSLRNKEN